MAPSNRSLSIRLHTEEILAEGRVIPADPARAHYLGDVMRCAVGDAVRLFNAESGEWRARIAVLARGRAELIPEAQLRPPAEEPDLWLVFALLKRAATDLVVQKATELGASALVPAMTARTNAERVNETRLHAIAVEAAEQCERLSVPEIRPPRPLAAILRDWPKERRLYAAVERAEARPLGGARGPAALLVGPEGGFTPAELDALGTHPFVVPVTLGPRILRAETAAIAGLALLQSPAAPP
jgi:16S rRNA (uracil1498-N3)-methyltransferase